MVKFECQTPEKCKFELSGGGSDSRDIWLPETMHCVCNPDLLLSRLEIL